MCLGGFVNITTGAIVPSQLDAFAFRGDGIRFDTENAFGGLRLSVDIDTDAGVQYDTFTDSNNIMRRNIGINIDTSTLEFNTDGALHVIGSANPVAAHFNPDEFFLNADSDSEVSLLDGGITLEKLVIGAPHEVQEAASSYVYGVRADSTNRRSVLQFTVPDGTPLGADENFRYTIFDGYSSNRNISVELTGDYATLLQFFQGIVADSESYQHLGFNVAIQPATFPDHTVVQITGYINDGSGADTDGSRLGFTIVDDASDPVNVVRVIRENGVDTVNGILGDLAVLEDPNMLTDYHWEQIELFNDVIFAGNSGRERIQIGAGASADTDQAIAIGSGSTAGGLRAVAIGHNAATTSTGDIRLGSSTAIVTVHPDAAGDETASPNTPNTCLLYTSPSPRDRTRSRMPSSA